MGHREMVGFAKPDNRRVAGVGGEELSDPLLARRSVDSPAVERNAADELGHEPVAAASGDDGSIGDHRRVAGDVDSRVAGADDEDAFPAELVGELVALAVAFDASERAWVARLVRHSLETGAGDDAEVSAPLTSGEGDVPTLPVGRFDRLGMINPGVELVACGEAVVCCPAVDVVADLPPARVGGEVVGHREVGPSRARR